MTAAARKAAEEAGGYKMQVKLLEKNKERTRARFILSGVSYQYANTLRRMMTEEVPTMAIERVEFRKNSSLLYDEVIAHRLGLIVLTTDLKGYSLPSKDANDDELKQQGAVFTLKAKGPGAVYASQFKSADPKIKPVFPETPIVTLIKDDKEAQELELEAVAVLGQGKNHAKWSPGLFYYTYQPKITVNNNSKNFDNVKDKFPSAVMTKDGKIDKNLIIENDLVDAVAGIDEDVVKVEYDESAFVFTMESWGSLNVQTIAVRATEMFDEQLDEFEKAIKAA